MRRICRHGSAVSQRMKLWCRKHKMCPVGTVYKERYANLAAGSGDCLYIHQSPIIVRACNINCPYIRIGIQRFHHIIRHCPHWLYPKQCHGIYSAAVYNARAEHFPALRQGKTKHGLNAERAPACRKACARRAKKFRRKLLSLHYRP